MRTFFSTLALLVALGQSAVALDCLDLSGKYAKVGDPGDRIQFIQKNCKKIVLRWESGEGGFILASGVETFIPDGQPKKYLVSDSRMSEFRDGKLVVTTWIRNDFEKKNEIWVRRYSRLSSGSIQEEIEEYDGEMKLLDQESLFYTRE
jgi:hypothetical protein